MLTSNEIRKFVTCPICDKQFKGITNSHIKTHGIDSFDDFKFLYPDTEYSLLRKNPNYFNTDKQNINFKIPNAICNKYYHWYMSIVKSRPNNRNVYLENHHIIPKSLGGSDNKDNLVALTSKEHFICHALLCKIFEPNTNSWRKMMNAFILMSADPMKQKRYINSIIYESYRKMFSKIMSYNQSGERNSNYGKTWVSNVEFRITRLISKHDLDYWLNLGYIKGKIKDFDKYLEKENKKLNRMMKSKPRSINPQESAEFLPNKSKTLTKFCQSVLDTSNLITWEELEMVKNIISNLIHIENYTVKEIQTKYNIDYSNFSMFLKKCLNIKLKSVKEANRNSNFKRGRILTNLASKYKQDCEFEFNDEILKIIPGYKDLLDFGWYNSKTNKNGVRKTHMISLAYGRQYNIDPKIMKHPANCQLLTNTDWKKKQHKSIITLDGLKNRINVWNNIDLIPLAEEIVIISLPKTKNHKKALSEAISGTMTITNGLINLKISKTSPIPEGFRRGMIRNNKK